MKGILLSLTIAAGCAAANAESKPLPIQTGTVISQALGSYNAGIAVEPLGAGRATVPINARENLVVLQTANSRLTLQESTRSPNWHHFIVLPVHGTVQYYQDGDWIIIIDSKHKKHKFAVMHIEVKAQ